MKVRRIAVGELAELVLLAVELPRAQLAGADGGVADAVDVAQALGERSERRLFFDQ
ncbi:MAG TPA: hypothetical protein RMI62_29375 [Polyangiaceae bacterium LLY-WYZ-15_(1-7)]|nr:hypothetical protein [Polyangiaceae bacterium LLY-WYZ-15_(1-7)]